MKERVYQWAQALCSCAGEGEEFLKDFWEMLTQSEGVYREFEYYLEHQTFLCEYKIAGYSVVDIMVQHILQQGRSLVPRQIVGMDMVMPMVMGVRMLVSMGVVLVMLHRKRLHIDTILTKYTIQHACQICKGYWKNI